MSEPETTDGSKNKDAYPQPPSGVPQGIGQPPQQEVQATQQSEPEHESKSEPEPEPRQPFQGEEGRSLFGPNGRWLWFAGGVFFVVVGVIFAALFNLRKTPKERSDAVQWAAYGMIVGFIINIVVLYATGGIGTLLGTESLSPSSGGIF